MADKSERDATIAKAARAVAATYSQLATELKAAAATLDAAEGEQSPLPIVPIPAMCKAMEAGMLLQYLAAGHPIRTINEKG
jgi:hypothetical protein